MRSLVEGARRGLFFRAKETVDFETFASLANSRTEVIMRNLLVVRLSNTVAFASKIILECPALRYLTGASVYCLSMSIERFPSRESRITSCDEFSLGRSKGVELGASAFVSLEEVGFASNFKVKVVQLQVIIRLGTHRAGKCHEHFRE